MEKDKLLRMIKEVIFEKVGEFNGLNRPESITNNDELARIWPWISLISWKS